MAKIPSVKTFDPTGKCVEKTDTRDAWIIGLEEVDRLADGLSYACVRT